MRYTVTEGYVRYHDESYGSFQFKDGLQKQLRRQTVVSNATLLSSRDRVALLVLRGNATSILTRRRCDVIAQEGVQRKPPKLRWLNVAEGGGVVDLQRCVLE